LLPPIPKKWLGRRGGWILFGAFAVIWLYFVLFCLLVLHYRSELPLILLLGGFAIAALFIYAMCYRLRTGDGITPQFLILVFLLGGFAAWIVPTALGPIWGTITGGPQLAAPLDYHLPWGTVEELSKILVVLVIARWVPVKNARVGLFIGAAVGFGFSAFENLEYGLTTFLDGGSNLADPFHFAYGPAVSDLAREVVIRELLGPFGHPLWTALLAAALFAGFRDGRFRLTARVIVTFVAVAVIHTLWDFLPAVFNLTLPLGTAVFLAYTVYVVFGVSGTLVWRVMAKRANLSALLVTPEPVPSQSSVLS
jgi:RsiW-degrading membrane proteinase PrsW (M82 family)